VSRLKKNGETISFDMQNYDHKNDAIVLKYRFKYNDRATEHLV